jgi:hypothetical protein
VIAILGRVTGADVVDVMFAVRCLLFNLPSMLKSNTAAYR